MTTDTVPQTVLFPDLFDKPLFAKFNQEQVLSFRVSQSAKRGAIGAIEGMVERSQIESVGRVALLVVPVGKTPQHFLPSHRRVIFFGVLECTEES